MSSENADGATHGTGVEAAATAGGGDRVPGSRTGGASGVVSIGQRRDGSAGIHRLPSIADRDRPSLRSNRIMGRVQRKQDFVHFGG